jgi:hypothetical protein
MSRTARVQIMFGLIVVVALPHLAYGQPANQAAFQARFDQALAVFNSARQPESISQFSQLIDDVRGLPNRSAALTTLLARALQYRAQARENVGQTAEADADLRLIREVAPDFRLTDPGLSAALVARFNALLPPPPGAAPAAQPVSVSSPKLFMLSAGYEYLRDNDCDGCKYPPGFYGDVAGQILPFLSWVGRVSGRSGTLELSDSSFDITSFFFGGGARVRPAIRSRLCPFGQLLVGGTRSSISDEFGAFSESKGAVSVSGGVDYLLTTKLGARFDVGYIKVFSEGVAGSIRVGIGATFMLR